MASADYWWAYPVYAMFLTDKDIDKEYDLATRKGFNPYRDNEGQFASKPGGKVVSLGSKLAFKKLAAGEKVTVSPGEVDGVMNECLKNKPFNIINLQVEGTGIFGTSARNIPRSEMPQLGSTQSYSDFTNDLASRGVDAELKTMDPRDMIPTQGELDSVKVAKFYKLVSAGKFDPSQGVIFVSDVDKTILDGHHRWAGMAIAAAATDKPLPVRVLALETDTDTMLEVAQKHSGARKGLAA